MHTVLALSSAVESQMRSLTVVGMFVGVRKKPLTLVHVAAVMAVRSVEIVLSVLASSAMIVSEPSTRLRSRTPVLGVAEVRTHTLTA